MIVKLSNIRDGKCNFCKQVGPVVMFNFQAVCQNCATNIFARIPLIFKAEENKKASKTTI